MFQKIVYAARSCTHIGLLVLLLASLWSPLLHVTRAIDWLPVSEDDRAATASTIDPEAGAEILHRIKEIDDSEYEHPVTEEYIQIKVYNEKGVVQLGKVDIECDDNEKIVSLQARVIKPDGTIINVEKSAIFDRVAVRYGDKRYRVRSFSFSGLEPGVVAEYKWVKKSDVNIFALKLRFMSEMPTRHVMFRIKPIKLPIGWTNMVYSHKCKDQRLQTGKNGFSFFEMQNLPALASEPNMPPADDVQPWILYYPVQHSRAGATFWKYVASEARDQVEGFLRRSGKSVQETAAMLTGGAQTPIEKLQRINDYCRSKILNIYHYTPHEGLDERLYKKGERTPAELIKTKLGNCHDIPILFIALARAVGIDARLVHCSNRTDGGFNKALPIDAFAREKFVAVKIDDVWHFYDPAHRLVNTGTLRWLNEGVLAMIVMPKEPLWVVTPKTQIKDSMQKRTAKMRLNDEGALMGEIKIEYSGQAEIDARYDFYWQTPQKIEEIVRERVKARMPDAEVTDVKVADSDNCLKPLVLTYSITVPGYAENAGSRFFIQPGFFTKGTAALFTAPTRKTDMFFEYGIAVQDDVTISVPAGFKLEAASAPQTIGDASWGSHNISIGYRKSNGTIHYNRTLVFSPRQVEAADYPKVKKLFETVHFADTHTLTLRVGE